MRRQIFFLLTLTIICMPLFFSARVMAQSKDQKEKIDRMAVQLEEMKTEMVLLQRQVQSMQDTFNKTTVNLTP